MAFWQMVAFPHHGTHHVVPYGDLSRTENLSSLYSNIVRTFHEVGMLHADPQTLNMQARLSSRMQQSQGHGHGFQQKVDNCHHACNCLEAIGCLLQVILHELRSHDGSQSCSSRSLTRHLSTGTGAATAALENETLEQSHNIVHPLSDLFAGSGSCIHLVCSVKH